MTPPRDKQSIEAEPALSDEIPEAEAPDPGDVRTLSYLETLIETAHDGIISIDEKGQFEFINSSGLALLGWPEPEILGSHFIKVIPEDLHDFITERWEEVQRGEGEPYEVDIVQKDGTRRSILVSHRQMKVAGHTKYAVVIRDISDRKKAESALRESRALLHGVVESLPFDFFAINTEGRYTLQNATGREHWGRHIGKKPEDLAVSAKTLALWKENNARAFRGETVSEEVTFSVRGKERHFHNIISPIRVAGRIVGILGVNLDISDRVRAEKALRESEQRYRALQNNVPVGLFRTSSDGRLLSVNAATVDILGYDSEEELLGTAVQDHYFHPNEQVAAVTKLKAVGSVKEFRVQLKKKNGEPFWASLSANRVADDSSDEGLSDGVLLDITTSVEAERMLEETQTDLERRVSERTSELRETNRRLQKEIIDRMHAEDRLRVSEERFRTQYKNIPVPTMTFRWIEDDLVLVDYNDAAHAMSHGAISAFVGQKAGELHRHNPEIRDDLRRCYKEKSSFSRERVYRFHTTGEERLFSASYAFVRPDLVMVHTDDITEARATQEIIRRNEERFRALIEKASDGVLIVDHDGTVSYASPSLERILGYRKEAFVGTDPDAYVHPDDLKEQVPGKEKLMQSPGTTLKSEIRIRHQDGSWRVLESNATNLLDNPAISGIVINFRDVTERRLANQALRESENRFRELAELLPQTVYEMDMEGRVTYVNRRALEISGLSKDFFDSRPEGIKLLIPEDRDRARTNLRAIFEGKESGANEYQALRGDGSRFPVMMYSSLITRDGKPVGVRGIIVDISERKAAERRQAALTEDLRAVVDITEELIRCNDRKTLYRRAVELAREKLGIERCSIFYREGDEVVGTYGTNCQGETIDESSYRVPIEGRWKRFFSEIEDTETLWTKETMPRHEFDGRDFTSIGEDWVVRTAIARRGKQPMAIFFNDAAITNAPFDEAKQDVVAVLCSIVGDISDRLRAVNALSESEERFTQVAASAQEWIWEIDADGLFTYCSPLAEQVIGYKPEELVGRHRYFEVFHPDSYESQRRDAEAIIASKKPINQMVFHCLHKNGQAAWLSVTASPLLNSQDELMAFRGTAVDITDRKRADEERQALAVRLLDIQEEERKKISALLHDHLGQLLFLTRLDLGSLKLSNDESQRLVETITKRIDDALQSVRDVAISLRPPLLDDLGIKTALETLVEEVSEGTHVKATLSQIGTLPELDSATETCLYRVLQEALTNVAKHADAHRVSVQLQGDKHEVVLRVADDGKGMPPADLSPKGIGLIGMRERLNRCGGTLSVLSESNKGTTLEARIPVGVEEGSAS